MEPVEEHSSTKAHPRSQINLSVVLVCIVALVCALLYFLKPPSKQELPIAVTPGTGILDAITGGKQSVTPGSSGQLSSSTDEEETSRPSTTVTSPEIQGENSQSVPSTSSNLSAQNTTNTGDSERTTTQSDHESTQTGRSGWSHYRDAEVGFAVSYPSQWTVSRKKKGDSLRVQFTISGDAFVAIDVNKSQYASITDWQAAHPNALFWGSLETRFKRVYGNRYERISMKDTEWGGLPANEWIFTLQALNAEKVKKRDIGGISNGRGCAIIYSAPISRYDDWENDFVQMMNTFTYFE